MKLFQRLLVAPAALGLMAPVAAHADTVRLHQLQLFLVKHFSPLVLFQLEQVMLMKSSICNMPML